MYQVVSLSQYFPLETLETLKNIGFGSPLDKASLPGKYGHTHVHVIDYTAKLMIAMDPLIIIQMKMGAVKNLKGRGFQCNDPLP